MRRPKKNTKKASSSSSMVERIPNEVLIYEVLGRVAASSLPDMMNVKLSCKLFNEIAEDKHVYQRVSLDKFPIIPWKPLSEEQQVFLNKCQHSQNPEVLYRQAVLDFFNKQDIKSATKKLDKALESGHTGAYYLACIIVLVCGVADDESKEMSIKYLSEFKKSESMKRQLRLCRNKLDKLLRQIWVTNPMLTDPPKCCATPNQHRWRNQWCEDEENSECEACNADREIRFICKTHNNGPNALVN